MREPDHRPVDYPRYEQRSKVSKMDALSAAPVIQIMFSDLKKIYDLLFNYEKWGF